MTERATRWLAAVAWVITGVILLANVVLTTAGARDLSVSGGDLFFPIMGALAGVLFSAIGLLIAVRARNVIGWMLVVAGISIGLATLSTLYAVVGVLAHPGSLPAPKVVAAVLQPMRILTFSSLALMLLLFPTGSPPSPRWRPVLWAGIAGALVTYVVTLLNPVQVNVNPGLSFHNPIGLERFASVTSTALVGLAWVTILASVASVAGLVVRFRGGNGELRQQVKWLAFAAGGACACLLVAMGSLLVCQCDESPGPVLALFFGIIVLGVPGALAVAIFKHRLYDIDVILSKGVLVGILAAFLSAVYLAVVIGVGTAIGSRQSPFLTIVAAVLIALAFQPARARARRLADHVVYGKRATPYEVLSEFSDRVAGAYAADEVLSRMAQILATGAGASAARIWLRSGNHLEPAASWPGDASAASVDVADDRASEFPSGELGVEVRHQGELLGALSVAMPASDPMNPAKEKLLHDLAAQAGLVLRNVRLIQELRASRRRIVTAQDERAKALERNIHDGAQQQLVALSVKQRIAQGLIDRDPAKARQVMEEIQTDTVDALETLRDLARGIYPPLLADKGLPAALGAQVRKAAVPVQLEADGIGRYEPEVEAAVYFCCLEALQNVAKYAGASKASVRLVEEDGRLTFTVTDDGAGFDPATTPMGTGLQGITDRLEALGGTADVRSEPGKGTVLTGRIRTRTAVPGSATAT